MRVITVRVAPEYQLSESERAWRSLSPQQKAILLHIVAGRSNREIGVAMCLSPKTVKNYVAALLAKLDVRDRTQMAVLAIACGWVEVTSDL